MNEIIANNSILIGKYHEIINSHIEHHRKFFENPASGRIEPFKIADNLYYVGDKYVCIHLIDTGDGLILLDSGYPGTAHLLIDNIWRAGFDPKDVRWIIHTHGHYDHFGVSEEFRTMFGTKLAISRVDADSIKEKPQRAHMLPESFPYAKIPTFDYEIEDGEIFELGNVKIRCVLTPGHTDGVLSLFFDVAYNGETYLAGLFGGVGIAALSLPYLCYHERPINSPYVMLKSVEKIENEPVVVHLGNHLGDNDFNLKYNQMLKEGGNPFVAPNSWKKLLDYIKDLLNKTIDDNEKLLKELQAGNN